jgi:hypothetical protein
MPVIGDFNLSRLSNNLTKNPTNQAKQRIQDLLKAQQKDADDAYINIERMEKATKELGDTYKEISKMKPSAITGKMIANSEQPYDKFTAFIDETNTFIESASECRDSLMRISQKIDKPFDVNANYELILDHKTKEEVGIGYSYEAKEIIILDEEKTRKAIKERANSYTVNDFLTLPAAGIEFDFLKMDNAAAVTAGFNNAKYNALTGGQKTKFDAFLDKLGLKFDENVGTGTIVKSAGGALDDGDLNDIKKDIVASIKLFDIDFPSITLKVSEVKSTLTMAAQTFDSTIKFQEEKEQKTITEKEQKILQYNNDLNKIEQKEAFMDAFYKQLEEEMKALNKMFDDMFKSLGLGNNDN